MHASNTGSSKKNGQHLEIDAPGVITLDETRVGLVGGPRSGFDVVPAAVFASKIAGGSLQRVLEDWTHFDPGLHIYYSSSRQLPVGLRLLIALIRELEPMGALP